MDCYDFVVESRDAASVLISNPRWSRDPVRLLLAALAFAVCVDTAWAGAQVEEELSSSVKSWFQGAVADYPPQRLMFETEAEGKAWLESKSR